MIHILITGFLAASVTALLVTPPVIALARLAGAMDRPDERKPHTAPMPRWGGLAIFLGAVVGFGVIFLESPEVRSSWLGGTQGMVLGIALTFVMALGAWDDRHSLGPGVKFSVEVVLATLMYTGGFAITRVHLPFAEAPLELGIFSYPLTLLWIVGITNAINLIDGLDGLASGVALIAALTIIPMAFLSGDLEVEVLAVVLAGALVGFLRYNFSPARIFMGDSGSLFLGFLLAVLSMTSSTKGSTVSTLLVATLVLGLPIVDTVIAMIRRALSPVGGGVAAAPGWTWKSLFRPDREHIHHKLLALGFSPRRSVLILYVVSLTLGVAALLLTMVNTSTANTILLLVGVAVLVGVRSLGYTEMALLRKGVFLPLLEHPVFERGWFWLGLYLGFSVLSFVAALIIETPRALWLLNGPQLLVQVVLAMCATTSAYFVGSLHRSTMHAFDFSETIRTVKAVAAGVFAAGIAISLAPGSPAKLGAVGCLLYFFFLLALILSSRSLLRFLRLYRGLGHMDEKPALIYGAGNQGLHLVRSIASGSLAAFSVVGFLDDDARLEGKRVNGLVVFGGYRKLRGLISRFRIETVIIASTPSPRVYRRLASDAREAGVELCFFRCSLEPEGTREAGVHSSRAAGAQTSLPAAEPTTVRPAPAPELRAHP